MHPRLRHLLFLPLALFAIPTSAQRFFNLTMGEVKVDSVLPHFVFSLPLDADYQDSLYAVKIKYPEYVRMTSHDIAAYNHLSGEPLPSEITPLQSISVSKRKATLVVEFCPLVFREHEYQALVSFMLEVKSKPLNRSAAKKTAVQTRAATDAEAIYASHSVLSSGSWAKIRVQESGVHELTPSVVRQAGFSDINKVRIYGYGGNLQNEKLLAADLASTDDLKEVPQCIVNGKHLFYGKGSVSWESNQASRRTRNPYSDYGYYFITQSDEDVESVDSATFVSSFYPAPDDYHSLYEIDGYSWYHGGRNLFDTEAISNGSSRQYIFQNPTPGTTGTLSVNVSAGTSSTAEINWGGETIGRQTVSISSNYEKGGEATASYSLADVSASSDHTLTITAAAGGPLRLDYVSIAWDTPKPAPVLAENHPAAEYVYNITNQDHHADAAADMIIIIPTSQKLLAQAERLKSHHESHDGLRVSIIPADELYNEFASGTPDANAYRRYLRMLQDRAKTEADMPKYLLLFGDCVWDNRMLTSDCKNLSPDDYLLCYESENSFSETKCYVSDSWMGILAEGAGGNPKAEQQDVAVGRFPVSTADEAQIMVDKVINYTANANAGAWENTIVMMGDDGNQNIHMTDENAVADYIGNTYPGFLIKKVMWDAYKRETSSTGNTYPEVTRLLKQYQNNGALIMDYAGHGSETQISHEGVLRITDFEEFRHDALPLWVTASCDIMPFDGSSATIGETAVLNPRGGAVAFYGTTRTVYTNYNKLINQAFLHHALSVKDGKPTTLGEAHRLAQNELVLGSDRTENHLQYSLLGDPALALHLPTYQVVVDTVNGIDATRNDTIAVLKAGSVARISGHIEGADDFQGVITATVRDSEEVITCKLNDTSDDGADEAFSYTDRQNTLYHGSDSVRHGRFTLTFAVPKDINYSDGTGLANFYAVSNDKSLLAHGASEKFIVGGSETQNNDSIGPSIYCYLNSSSFVDGGDVNTTPYFVAQISDKDGINAAGSGIGHDMQLIIDGDMSKTYSLNDNFTYDFGTYTSGTTFYSIPELQPGKHQLLFRAWDIQNNSSTAILNFNVVKGLKPSLFDVNVTENPAKTSTTFIISHDRTETDIDVEIEVFDTSGRLLWRHHESGVPTSEAYTVKWDLSIDGGKPLRTGIYLYRVKIASEGSEYASKANKLIILR